MTIKRKVKGAWRSPGIGPESMTARERERFFAFYKKRRSRRLFGFFRDIRKSDVNNTLLSQFLGVRTRINCLIMGCSHWSNPTDLAAFLQSYNIRLRPSVVALDVLPDALWEGIQHRVDFLPILSPAQTTPFLDCYFDIVVADGLLNCCGFAQHEPIIREMHRIAKPKAVVLLGIAHGSHDMVLKPTERAMVVHCRSLEDFKSLFARAGFTFPRGSSIETSLSKRSEIKIDNCIARK